MPRKQRSGYYVKGAFVESGSEADQKLRDELHDADAPSRTAKKRASERLQQLGEQLIAAREPLLAGLPLPESLADAIAEARSIKSFGAQRRQRQLVGKLMRRLDEETLAAIRAALGAAEHE